MESRRKLGTSVSRPKTTLIMLFERASDTEPADALYLTRLDYVYPYVCRWLQLYRLGCVKIITGSSERIVTYETMHSDNRRQRADSYRQ